MVRFLSVAILIACIVYALHASPVEPEPQSSNTNDLDTTFKNAMESIQKSFQNILNDPQLNELYKNGTRALQSAADTVRKEIDKIVPKTD